jgi:hypothetical protein
VTAFRHCSLVLVALLVASSPYFLLPRQRRENADLPSRVDPFAEITGIPEFEFFVTSRHRRHQKKRPRFNGGTGGRRTWSSMLDGDDGEDAGASGASAVDNDLLGPQKRRDPFKSIAES